MFSKSWSEMTKVLKSLKEVKDTLKLDFGKSVKDTIKLHLVKSLKEVKDKYAGLDLENASQKVSAPLCIIVAMLMFSSNASGKLLVVSEEQRDHLKAIRCVLDPSYAVEEEKQTVGEEKEKQTVGEEKDKKRGLPCLLDEQNVAFRKLANAWKDEPNISARDYVKIVYGTF